MKTSKLALYGVVFAASALVAQDLLKRRAEASAQQPPIEEPNLIGWVNDLWDRRIRGIIK